LGLCGVCRNVGEGMMIILVAFYAIMLSIMLMLVGVNFPNK